ncbi:MAG: hypothetical protein UX27_C0023G0001 [Candidatus Azambacteria bacterium GW2011_GWA2_45_90]|uniref:Uncharacterized protein n=1 Tax=Candidatus Azambacteria bacterium GW2011_GWA2_45_90 TaxID=1618614 RepID=A0A0G1QJP4_9BACT|nr:MAG: hypothetical protein UX27_C0023G0001 [Candidatus Azambacteria bacterium GW2011_GWA2_45_90]
MDCARHKQICMCLTHPPVRAQIPAVFRRYYKTAGVAPLNNPIESISFYFLSPRIANQKACPNQSKNVKKEKPIVM